MTTTAADTKILRKENDSRGNKRDEIYEIKIRISVRTPAVIILQHNHKYQSVKTIIARMRTTVLTLRRTRA